MFEVMEYSFYGDELDIRVIAGPFTFKAASDKIARLERYCKPGAVKRYYIRRVLEEDTE